MGHASINVTLDRYGHLFPELDEAIAQAFGREFEDARRRRASALVHASFGEDRARRALSRAAGDVSASRSTTPVVNSHSGGPTLAPDTCDAR
jgi:hypothetical protein